MIGMIVIALSVNLYPIKVNSPVCGFDDTGDIWVSFSH